MKQRTRRLFVARLPFETTPQDILEHFAQFGDIADVYCPKDPNNPANNKGFGFISYRHVNSSQKAFNSAPHVIRGREVVIDYALERPNEDTATSTTLEQMNYANYAGNDLSNENQIYHLPVDSHSNNHFDYNFPQQYMPNYVTSNLGPDMYMNFQPEFENPQLIYSYENPAYFSGYSKHVTRYGIDTSRNSFQHKNKHSNRTHKDHSSPNKAKIPFEIHFTDIKKDYFTACIKFEDSPQSYNDTTSPKPKPLSHSSDSSNIPITSQNINSANQPDISTHDDPTISVDSSHLSNSIPIDVNPNVIPSIDDEINLQNAYPDTLEFNINIPSKILNEIKESENFNDIIHCRFNFYASNYQTPIILPDNNIKQAYSKRTKISQDDSNQDPHEKQRLSRRPLNLNSPTHSANQRHLTSPSSSNHDRTSKRPPGGNEWIRRGHRIYVGQLGSNISSDDLKIYFQKYGEVVDAYIPKDFPKGVSRGFGFVTFLEPQVVEDLINTATSRTDEIKGSKIMISKARPS